MKAVVAPEPGGPEALRLEDRPEPVPGPGDLLVAVHAAGVNRADTQQRRGAYPPPPGVTDVLGLELAGEVVATGDDVREWRPGDAVCGIVAGGAYAEYATIPAGSALPLPDGLDLIQSAAIPEAFATAFDNVLQRGRLARGETLLVHGGSSGVGTAAVQLAVRAGARVLVTASSEAKLQACRDLGADAGIDYTTTDFVAAVHDLTDGEGVDVILDVIGGPYLERNLRALAVEGRLVVIGLMGGGKVEFHMGLLMPRRLTVTASTLRARPDHLKAALADALRAEVWPGFGDGSLRPVIDRVYPLEQVADAHARMESSAHIGKLLLTMR